MEEGCAEITRKYGYPSCAVLKNTKKPIINNNQILQSNKNNNNVNNLNKKASKQLNNSNNTTSKLSKFPEGVNFPTFSKNDHTYPL